MLYCVVGVFLPSLKPSLQSLRPPPAEQQSTAPKSTNTITAFCASYTSHASLGAYNAYSVLSMCGIHCLIALISIHFQSLDALSCVLIFFLKRTNGMYTDRRAAENVNAKL